MASRIAALVVALACACAASPDGESRADEPGPVLELEVLASAGGRIGHRIELVVEVDHGSPTVAPTHVTVSLPRGKTAGDFASAVAANLRQVGLVARFARSGDHRASLALPPPATFTAARARVVDSPEGASRDEGTLAVSIHGRVAGG